MPCVACREVVVGLVCATVHATDDCLQWASSHSARTFVTSNGDLARPQALALAFSIARFNLSRFRVPSYEQVNPVTTSRYIEAGCPPFSM